MDKNNAKKMEQLGIPFGTANGKLRKMILFDLVKRFGLDDCFRCGRKIETIEDFTIEHKKAWLNVDPALFWEMDNIAFSHMVCNIGAGERHRSSICWRCRKAPGRRKPNGQALECKDCHNEIKRSWRARTGKPRSHRIY